MDSSAGGREPDDIAEGNGDAGPALTGSLNRSSQRKTLSEAVMAQSASGTGTSVATIDVDGSAAQQHQASIRMSSQNMEPARMSRKSAEPQARKSKLVILSEPRARSPALVQKDKDRTRMYQAAGERSMWPPNEASMLAPEDDPSGWQDNHQVLYSNANLHPNYRSYFDRFRNRRNESSEDLPGELKPSWRLSPNPPHPDEKEAKKHLMRSTGSCAVPETGNKVEVLLHPATFSVPPSLRDADCPGAERSGLEADAANALEPKDGQELSETQPGEPAMDEVERPQTDPAWYNQPAREPWSDRHYVTWCNERHTMGKTLNPMLLRSYFDRMRFPLHARCEAQVKAPLMRTLPEWRLRMDPLTGRDIGRSTDGSMASAPSIISAAVDCFKAPTRAEASRSNTLKEGGWNHRHDNVFINEEVSRLDRCYFDRWREPESNLHNERTVRSLKPTWSLTRDGSPDATARELLAKSASRHAPAGNWNSRHERMFTNKIHFGARSYFSRPREPEDMAASRQRKKATEADKLKVDWSLQDHASVDFPTTLRAASAPVLPTATRESTGSRRKPAEPEESQVSKRQTRKKRPDWFSSHGVKF